VVPVEELKAGLLPQEIAVGDGKCKLNLGSAFNLFYYGWQNIDGIDVKQYAQANRFLFRQHDMGQGLPFKTGEVDLAFLSHVLEHFSFAGGLSLLREIRRVIKPTGALRILVPNATTVIDAYCAGLPELAEYDEVNGGCADAITATGKMWALLHEGHSAAYDQQSLCHALDNAGWDPRPTRFQETKAGDAGQQILRETIEMPYHELSLVVDAVPKVG